MRGSRSEVCFKCGRREIPGVTDCVTVTLPPAVAAFHGGKEEGSLCEECLLKALKSKNVVRHGGDFDEATVTVTPYWYEGVM
jgi:hypothetical protein